MSMTHAAGAAILHVTGAFRRPMTAGVPMHTGRTVTVRSIAFLDTFCKETGIPSTLEVEVPAAGIPARELAASIGLPTERIEGVFLNHRTRPIEVRVMPGDRVAFVPPGTPASHPAFFGAFDKGARH